MEESRYNIRIRLKAWGQWSTFKFGIDLKELEDSVVNPYYSGGPIIVDGRIMPLQDIDRITIKIIEESSLEAGPVERVMNFIFRPDEAVIFDSWGLDVTEDFIEGPPGSKASQGAPDMFQIRPAPETREVFVVHGRNSQARDALFDFLRAIDLHPLEWSEAIHATGKASPYIGEILTAAFSRAHAVVVLLTPDDEAILKEPLRHTSDPPFESQLMGQARPNVLFEAGMAMAGNQDRTVLVELGALRPFSDIVGRHAIRLHDSSEVRQELAQRLITAGCPVRLAGTGWHTAGDFGTVLGQLDDEP